MSTRQELQQGLISWVSLYASPNYPTALPAGTVVWFNRMTPFVSNLTDAGIYLRILSHKSPGKSGLKYTPHPITGQLVPEHYSTDKIRLQVQAKTLADTDDESALTWLSTLAGRIWWPESRALLLTFDVSIIEQNEVSSLADIIWDDREASVGNFEIVLHWRSSVLGPSADPIQHVTATGTVDDLPDVETDV